MPEEKIGIIGISTLDGPLGPSGNHLRWTFPRALGFPPKGFRIFRRKSLKRSGKSIIFLQLPLNEPLPDDLHLGGVTFSTLPPATTLRCKQFGQERRLTITPTLQAQLDLRFPEPIVHARLELGGTGFGTLRAYRRRKLLAELSTGGDIRELFCSGVTRLIMDLGAGHLRSISFTTETEACNYDDWALIKDLQLPLAEADPLNRFEPNLKNYYAASTSEARSRYDASASEIVKWLTHLLAPTNDIFEDPHQEPHLLKIRSDAEDPSTATYLQSLFFLAALDPNLARLMSLYWVDAFEPAPLHTAPPPKKEERYDYKIEGQWKDANGSCGLLLNLGQPSALPTIQPKLTGKQLNGLRWLNREWVGRLGLSWPRPELGKTPEARAAQPVLYEIARVFKNKEEKLGEPVLVNDASWSQSDPVLYVDRDLKLGDYFYKVRPIDLFGQLGFPLTSEPIKVQDNEAPPPPIRTRTLVTQNGTSASIRLQFEFGAAQHQQAPDVKAFTLYWRPDSLFARAQVNIVVTSTVEGANGITQTLRIRDTNLTSIPVSRLETFVGDVLTNVITNGSEPLPANERKRFRIAKFITPDQVVLEPAATKITNGNYELVRDPHNRAIWSKLSTPTIDWREPLTGTLNASETGLPAQVLSVHILPSRSDPFASVPSEARPRQFPNVPPTNEIVEIEIDRLITEPGVYAEGEASKPGWLNPVKLIYVITSLSQGTTRIALPASTPIAVGDKIDLLPAPAMVDLVRRLTVSGTVDNARLRTPGGEIAFESHTGDSSRATIMRVISNALNHSGTFDLVVCGEDESSISLLHPAQTRICYYAPFVVTLPVTLTTSSSRDAFLTVSSIDNRNNEGPLGAPSQVSVTLPPPAGAPSKPYPCGMDVNAAAGYASPPNRAGRATTCVTWDTSGLSPSEGLRFEVARALDNTILTTHLRDWQMGKVQISSSGPVAAGPTLTGTVVQVNPDEANGLLRVLFIPATPVSAPETFRNGRLVKDGNILQVTLAKSANSALELLLRGLVGSGSLLGTASLEAPPDYSETKQDVSALQIIALQVPDAFALVTGVPIKANKFTDDVAGVGRNKFFYRVRAVDASENRSEWSPLSAPFHQVDTTPPDVPVLFQALGGDRHVTLQWLHDPDSRIVSYRVFRSSNLEELQSQPLPFPIAEIAAGFASEFEYTDAPLDGTVGDARYHYCVSALKRVPRGPSVNDVIDIESRPSKILSVQVLDLSLPPSPEWLTAEWWDLNLNTSATNAGGNVGVRLEWSTSVKSAECVLERSNENQIMWQQQTRLIDGAVTTDGRIRFLFIDTNVDPSLVYAYRIRLRNAFGRENIDLRVIQVDRLR